VTTISVIVPASDAPATLEACLAAIDASARRPDEVLVVDDPSHLAPAAARNAGALRASSELLVFVDADVVVHASAIGLLAQRLEDERALAAVFGAYDEDPGAGGLVSGYRFLLHREVHLAGAGPAQTFWSGLGAVRRDAFLAAGGFDAQRRWLEDVDLGLRLRAAGHSITLDPAAQGKHLKHLTLRAMLRSDALERAAPWTDLLLRHRSGTRTLNLSARNRLSALAALGALAALLARRIAPVAAALALVAALNLSLLAAVRSARGMLAASLAVPLHALHHLAGLAGAVVGAAGWLRAGRPRGSAGSIPVSSPPPDQAPRAPAANGASSVAPPRR